VNLATGESALLQNIGDIFTTAQALTYLTSDKPLASIGSLNGHFIVWPALENMIHGSLTFTTLSTDHVTGKCKCFHAKFQFKYDSKFLASAVYFLFYSIFLSQHFVCLMMYFRDSDITPWLES